MGFNPRSRTGNDPASEFLQRLLFVSIHVPARGTTVTEEEADRRVAVSIHVPARGTTFTTTFYSSKTRSFNPRSRTGNDIFSGRFSLTAWKFQSTFPHGERLQSSTNFLCAFCSYLCNYTNKFRSTQPLARFSSHFTSKSRCESPWNSMFTPDSHRSVIALPSIRNH